MLFPFEKIANDYSKEVQSFRKKWSFDYILESISAQYLRVLSGLNHILE